MKVAQEAGLAWSSPRVMSQTHFVHQHLTLYIYLLIGIKQTLEIAIQVIEN